MSDKIREAFEEWYRNNCPYAAPPAAEQHTCDTCNGHGLVGGLKQDGYDSETCPQCAGTGYDCPDCITAAEQPDTVNVSRELLRQACSEDRTLRATARFSLRALLGGGNKP